MRKPKSLLAPQSLLSSRFLFCCIIVGLCVSLYGSILEFSFVDFDDNRNVFDNPHLLAGSTSAIGWFWTHAYEGLYIPVPYTLWSLLAANFQSVHTDMLGADLPFDPGVFHLLNLFIHSCNALLVWTILRRLGFGQAATIVGTILFVVHPLQVEAVAWVTGLKDLVAATFCLASIVFATAAWERHNQQRPVAWAVVLTGVTFVLALASKPSAVTLPALIGIVFYMQNKTAPKQPSQRFLVTIACLVGTIAIAYSVFVMSLQPTTSQGEYGLLARTLVPLDALGFYIAKLILPLNLMIPYDRSSAMVVNMAWQNGVWLIPLGVAALMGIGWLRQRFAVPLLFSCVALSPTLGFFPYWNQIDTTVADRYMYLAMLGPAMIVATIWRDLPVRGARFAVACALISMFILSYRHIPVWKNTITLLEHTIKQNDNNVTVHERLAYAYLGQNRVDKAAMHFERRLHLNPYFPAGWQFLAGHYKESGDTVKGLDALLSHFKTISKHESPEAAGDSLLLSLLDERDLFNAKAWAAAGFYELLMGRPSQSQRALQVAIRQDPAIADNCFAMVLAFSEKSWDHAADATLAEGFDSIFRLLAEPSQSQAALVALSTQMASVTESLPLARQTTRQTQPATTY